MGSTLAAQSSPKISLQGSELLGEAVVQAWTAYGEERGINIDVSFRGSRPARDRLEAGVIDMAVLIDDPAEEDRPQNWVSLPLAHVAALVVAPRGLSLEQLSYEDLNRIYSAGSAVATTRWGDFGATGKWEYTPISMHVLTSASGLAHGIFRNRVLRDGAFKGSVREHDELDSVYEAMAGDEGGIGVVSWWDREDPKFKVLLVSPAGDQVAFGPSAENMGAGDYPLSVPLRLVVAREDVAELLPILQFWYRDEISVALEQDRLMPLPRVDRNQQVFDLEAIE